jgi:hypothetical protein
MSYLALDAAEIVRTIERLGNRIEERFPGSGLGSVCRQLLEISRRARERAEVNEIEDLTTGLSRKIWQRLTIVIS